MDFSRREFVAAAVGAAATVRPLSAGASGAPRTIKTIPSSGETIPAIGMGSWLTFNVGGDAAAIAQRRAVLDEFFSLGGALIDSSPMYGSSQAVIGECLQGRDGAPVFAADKVWVRGAEAGRDQIIRSRNNWGVDRFRLMQVHNLVDWRAHLDTLFEMKAAGEIDYVGVTSYAGIRYDDIAAIMASKPLDFVQVTYNAVDREAETRILPLAQEKGVAVIANRPFREGALIDRARRRPLPGLAGELGAGSWAETLLLYIISHPAITAAIPATRRPDHMRENMAALRLALPDAAMRRRIEVEVARL